MKVILSCFFLLLCITIYPQQNPEPQKSGAKIPARSAQTNADLTYKIISGEHKTWGYDIYREKKLFIHQPSIPGLPETQGFKTKADAGKVAEAVIGKIMKGEIPPSVTIDELKKMDVL